MLKGSEGDEIEVALSRAGQYPTADEIASSQFIFQPLSVQRVEKERGSDFITGPVVRLRTGREQTLPDLNLCFFVHTHMCHAMCCFEKSVLRLAHHQSSDVFLVACFYRHKSQTCLKDHIRRFLLSFHTADRLQDIAERVVSDHIIIKSSKKTPN